MGLYIATGLAFIASGIVLLSFFGPEPSERPFWKMIHRIRSVFDTAAYTLFNAIAFIGIARGLYELIIIEGSDPAQTLLKRAAGILGTVLLGGILVYSIFRYFQKEGS